MRSFATLGAALATRVLFDDTGRAIGVEYLEGDSLYGAHPRPSRTPGKKVRVFAAREVILAGGAFNTPQLLMLSGIGPAQTLETHGIPVRVASEGVGRNLQDRYEVAVVNRMNFDAWDVLEGATFTRNDEQYALWRDRRKGVYASNGVILSLVAWLMASVLRALAVRALDATNLDEKLSSGAGMSPMSQNAGNVLFWLVILMFLPAVLNAFRLNGLLQPVTAMVTKLLDMVPNGFAALLIAGVGYLVAKVLRVLFSARHQHNGCRHFQ